MGWLSRIFSRKEQRGQSVVTIPDWLTTPLASQPMKLSAVYRCVEVISDGVAMLPLRLYQRYGAVRYLRANDPMADVLDRRPDDRMTRYTLMKSLVADMLLDGNAYAIVDRETTPARLCYVPACNVSPVVKREGGVCYIDYYDVVGRVGKVEPRDMLHILNHSLDGLVGVSTIDYAGNTVKIARGGEQRASDYFDGSGVPSGVLTVTGGVLDKDKRDKIQRLWAERMRHTNGGLAILEGNMSYQQMTIKPADAQLLESRQYSVVDICRFFGVSPVKCFDLSKSSYSTVEATQLAFLTDTLQPALTKIEQEINRKYFLPSQSDYMVKFSTAELLRADLNAQANYYRTMVNIGAMTPNEVRAMSDLEPINGGDNAYLQVNMTTLAAVAAQTKKSQSEENGNGKD